MGPSAHRASRDHGATRTSCIRPLIAGLAVLVAAASAVAVAAGPAAAEHRPDEVRLFELTNDARADNGKPYLAYDAAASSVARAWAAELARSGNLRHNPNLAAQVDAYVTNQWT